MALFFRGMPCTLCGVPITADEEVRLFSPFVGDPSEPLIVFSDAAVHARCLAQHPLGAEAMKWQEESLRRGEMPRICVACGEPILHPDEYFGAGLLSRDPANPLYEFNFVQLHRGHAPEWPRFDEFRRLVEEAEASDSWRGAKLVFDRASEDFMLYVVPDNDHSRRVKLPKRRP